MIESQPGGLSANRPSRIIAIAASLVAILIVYLVIRMTAPYLNPALATVLPPEDPSFLARALPYAAGDPRQPLTEEVLVLSRRTALSTPLAFEPFFVAAKAEEQAGRLDNAIRLMEEARRRRPSFDLTRVHLVAYYQQARRFPELLTEIDFVLRRNQEAAQVILPELAKLLGDREGRIALAAILARDPVWKPLFFEVAAAQPGNPADALALLNLTHARYPGRDLTLERGLYLQRLLQAGEHARARSIWLQSLPANERQRHALLFNGDFRRIRAPHPFGWNVHQEAQGRAEIVSVATSRPYLDVVYFGGSRVVLAEQQVALAPGRYRLSQLVKGERQPTSGEIYWGLACLPGGDEIARLPLGRVQPQFGRATVEFTVPANCGGQQLALIGEPGDIAAEIRIQLTALELARAN